MKRSIDWPPTSKERPGLVAYGAPRKLPRLDEGPYVDVWMNVVRQVVEEHKKRWKKAVIFHEVHNELCRLVARCQPHRNPNGWSGSIFALRFERARFGEPITSLWSTYNVRRQFVGGMCIVLMWERFQGRGEAPSSFDQLIWCASKTERWSATDIYGRTIWRCREELRWREEIRGDLRRAIRQDCECRPCQDGRPWEAVHLRRHFLDVAPKEFDFGRAKAKMEEYCSEYEGDFIKEVDRGDFADVIRM